MIHLDATTCSKLQKVLQRDADFLASLQLMDYSILLAIETVKGSSISTQNTQERDDNRPFKRKFCLSEMAGDHDFNVENVQHIYHLGIIDYLQLWNLSKTTERVVKSLFNRQNYHTISAVSPKEYSERFNRFMKTHVIKMSSHWSFQREFINTIIESVE